MRDNGQAIVNTFKQIQEIYKQISLLLSAADSLMTDAQWISDNSVVLYNTSTNFAGYDKWSPFIIRRTYINEKFRKLRKYIAVKIYDAKSKDFKPIVIGTTIEGGCDQTPEFCEWDAYWWWEQKRDGKIERPKEVYSTEDRELTEINIISHPLVAITNSDKLQEYIIGPLLEYTG